MAALEKEPNFASIMSEGSCVLITHQVTLMPSGEKAIRISSISLRIAWIEIQV